MFKIKTEMFKKSFNNVMITLSYEKKSDQALIDQQLEDGSKLLSNLKVYPLVHLVKVYLLKPFKIFKKPYHFNVVVD